ncbi:MULTISPECIES: hypothetical protein [Rhodococcus]|uniref:hypothetical protein n=1 Tax=Rhodococcus TaxID=1827 RepID=UPI001E323C0A|nr:MULTISPECIES: hypothetical protein [Rhodococcus]BDB62859.1 hypothetical protein RDE2_46530 [Rhodococcus sp. RDE2]
MTFGPLLTGLCDDAALFPPGNAPLPVAVPAHAGHRSSAHAPLVEAFVFPAGRLGELADHLAQHPYPGELALSLTAPTGTAAVRPALEQVDAMDSVSVVALEIAVPAEQSVDELFAALGEISADRPDVDVFVEVPRDERRAEILARMVGTPYAAKFRTGGIVAEAYPDEAELAAAVGTVVTTGVPFKATAGLHHAVRNTDPKTGFEQHGFVNLLAAVDAVLSGADTDEVASVLAERDGAVLSARLGALSDDRAAEVRRRFLSYGTCSIAEPLEDLLGLGLVPPTVSPITEGTNA